LSELSQAGVDHLKNMKRLHTLQFFETDYKSLRTAERTPDFIIALAGEVPSLRHFTFPMSCGSNQNDFMNDFFEKFAEKYPGKELLMDDITYFPVYCNFCTINCHYQYFVFQKIFFKSINVVIFSPYFWLFDF
jgi:hypothetical protein